MDETRNLPDSAVAPRFPEAVVPARLPAGRASDNRGPETVINPEGRPAPVEAYAEPYQVPSSTIVRTLFPVRDEQADESQLNASNGVQLGHFLIVERIRSGGMGAVFRALDTRLNRVVALKILPPGQTRDASSVQRFRNEAQAAAQLDHENIARVFYIGEEQALHFIAFEYITGTNLRELIQQYGQLSVGDSVNYCLQIASALLHTSAKGVIHRDIKPSNIIITPQGRAKLVDLGLARKENKDDAEADLTLAGTTLGTFDYISPEQARDPRTADVRSDIYSLGCTLYHMLTGSPPFPEGTVLQKLLQHQGDDAPDPALSNRKVPENLSAIVRKMMAKDPRRRYQSAELLVRDLMLVAGSMGLRSLNSEGLVWISSQSTKASFWERHLAWIATGTALLLIVGYVELSGTHPEAKVVRQPQPSTKPSPVEQAPVVAATVLPEPARKADLPEDDPAVFNQSKKPAAPVIAGIDTPPAAVTVTEPDGDRKRTVGVSVTATEPVPNRAAASFATELPDGRFLLGPPSSGDTTPQRLSPPEETAFAGIGPVRLDPSTAATARAAQSNGTASESEVPIPGDRTDSAETSRKPTPDRELPAVDAISIVGAEGAPRQSFPTLESACSAAVDGTVIELRFNGRRSEMPFRITKRLTIRAAKGFRPTIEFLPLKVPAEGFQTRMVTITSGSVDVVGVDLLMNVNESIAVDAWSFFAIQRADYVRLQNVTLTIINPKQRAAAVAELQPNLIGSMPDMEIGVGQQRPPLEIEVSGSLVRGDGDLFLIRNVAPARLAVKESVVALQGSLLYASGGAETPSPSSQIELRLDHVTAALAGGLVKLDSGDAPRKLVPVQVSASNCIFTTNSQEAFVTMTGNSPVQDFRPFLVWSGQKNFYNRIEKFWSIAATDGTGKTDTLDFNGWQKNWGSAAEVDPQDNGVLWERDWKAKPLAELTAADFALDRQSARNLAVLGATNGSDAGADLSALSKLGRSPTEAPAGSALD